MRSKGERIAVVATQLQQTHEPQESQHNYKTFFCHNLCTPSEATRA